MAKSKKNNNNILHTRNMSIVTKVAIAATFFLVTTSTLLTAMSGLFSILQSRESTKVMFEHITEAAALAVKSEFDGIKDTVEELGMTADLYERAMNHEELHEYLEDRAAAYRFKAIYLTNTNGVTEEGIDFSQYNFCQRAINGEVCLLAPQVTAAGDASDIMVSAPIYKGGIKGSTIVGAVIVVIDGYRLTELISGVNVGETGDVYVIDETGRTIADIMYEYVLSEENTIASVATDPEAAPFANVEKLALAGESAVDIVKYDGDKNFLCVVPLEGYGWALGAMALEMEYIGAYVKAAVFSLIVAVVMVGIAFLVMRKWLHDALDPLKDVAKLVKGVSEGDYSNKVEYANSDEIGDIVNACNVMVDSNSAVIGDAGKVLSAMANGDFTAYPSATYLGEFKQLESALQRICKNMRETFRTIASVSQSVGHGSQEVDAGATTLAQGTTEQAASIEELVSTLNDVIKQVHTTATNSKEADKLVAQANAKAVKGSEQMALLEDAMAEIEHTSNEISRIIKSIEDIAFQTNILALNAAVEAARAGTAGKGFSVVADEVRSLAAKSAAAAKDTAERIEAALAAIGKGVDASKVTGQYLAEVTADMREVVERIDEISNATGEQSISLDQIATGTDQISAVVQTNSATAEQSAAASASMRMEADKLQNIVAHLKI